MKKQALFIVAMFIALGSWGQAPNWAWAKSAGGTGYDWGEGISTDASGNIVVTGVFSSPTITFGTTTLTNIGANDIFVVKYDPSGNVLWAKSAGGTNDDRSKGISTDASGNIVVTGLFDSPKITFGSNTLTNSGFTDIFVVKYDPSGNVLWAKSAGGTNDDSGYDISTDASGNIVVTGAFRSPTITFGTTTFTTSGGWFNIFVVKYDPSGNVLWAKSAGGSRDAWGRGISTDASGNIVVAGGFDSPTITFGTTTLTTIGGTTDLVVKYDPSGNVLWAKSAGNTDGGYDISTDASGNIVVTGVFASPTITFGTTTLTKISDYTDIYVVKYDPSGNVLWAKSAGGITAGPTTGDWGEGISTDAIGNIVVTGKFSSPTITFGTTTLTNTNSFGLGDIFVVKYDPSGNVLWGKSVGGTEDDLGYGISMDTSGNIVVTGGFNSPNITFGATILTNSFWGGSMFVSKLSSTTGLKILNKTAETLVSPNPFNNATLIKLPESVQNADIIVSDLLGKKVVTKKFSGKEYLLEKGTMSPGIYFVQISDAQHQYPITKIVVQ